MITASTAGVVRLWGYNASSGHIGDGTQSVKDTPVDISDAAYLWKVGRPVFSPVPTGTPFSNDQPVTITSETPGADIHYTLDGNDPTPSDPLYVSGNPVTIDETLTLKARAYKSGHGNSYITSALYTMRVAMPELSPLPGAASPSPINVAMTTATTTGATIRYTTDGTAPTASSAIYTAPLAIATKTRLRAAAFRDGWTASNPTGIHDYTFNYGTLATPCRRPPRGPTRRR